MKISEHSFLSIAIGVTSVHFIALLWLALSTTTPLPTKPTEKLVVNTVQLRQSPSKPIPKPVVKTKAPQKKKQEPKKNQKIALVKENLAKLRETRDKFNAIRSAKGTTLKDLSSVKALRIDSHAAATAEESQYYHILAGRLRETLKLPEEGDVKIQLILNRKGNVVSVKTLATDNGLNQKYVEAKLQKLQFPPFGNNFKQEETHSFTITLTSDQ